MRLIVVSGMPGAGKEEFLNVAHQKGIPFFRMGDVVREFYAKSDSEAKGISVGNFADIERKKYGVEIWAKRVIEKANNAPIALIDGCRSRDEIIAFEKAGGEVVSVAILAPQKLRYSRLQKRARNDAPKNIEEFNERDKRELSWGAGNAIALADYPILNLGTLDEFKKSVEGFLREIL